MKRLFFALFLTCAVAAGVYAGGISGGSIGTLAGGGSSSGGTALLIDGSNSMTGTLNAINASFTGRIDAGTGTLALPALRLQGGFDPDTGFYATTDNEIRFGAGATAIFRVGKYSSSTGLSLAGTNGLITFGDGAADYANCGGGTAAGTSPNFRWTSDTGTGLGRFAKGQPSMVASGVEVMRFTNAHVQAMAPLTMAGSGTQSIGSSTQYFLSRSTGTAASGTELFRDGNTASSRIPAIANNGVMSYDGIVTAIASDSYAGKWKISGAYMVSAGSGTVKLTSSDVLEEYTMPAWAASTVRPAVIVTGGQLYFYASGPANVSWSCDLKCVYSKW